MPKTQIKKTRYDRYKPNEISFINDITDEILESFDNDVKKSNQINFMMIF